MANIPDARSLVDDVRRLDGRCSSILWVAFHSVLFIHDLRAEKGLVARKQNLSLDFNERLVTQETSGVLQELERFERQEHDAERDDVRWAMYWHHIETTVGMPKAPDRVCLVTTLGIPVWQIGAIKPTPILANTGRVAVEGNVRECIIAGFELDLVQEAYAIFRRAGSTLRTQTLADAGISPSPNSAANWTAYLLVEFENQTKSTQFRKGEGESCRVLEHPLSASRELLERYMLSGGSSTAIGYEPKNGEAAAECEPQGDGEREARPHKITPKPRIRVDAESCIVHIDGKAWPLNGSDKVKRRLAAFIQALINADGEFLPRPQAIKSDQIERQPVAIKSLLDAQPGAGTRIPREKLV